MEKREMAIFVEAGLSVREIGNRMGRPSSTIRYWLKKHNLKTTGRRGWTDNNLKVAVKESIAMSEVFTRLGLSQSAGNYPSIAKHVERLQLDTSHFTGKSHGRGGKKRPLVEVMKKSSTYSRSHLKNRLLKNGLLKNTCSVCELSEIWNGKPITMILDHVNGVRNDHRIENLRMVCPNCNSQLPTFSRGSSGVIA